MNASVGATPLDETLNPVVGRPLDRVEGPLKVQGRVPYAYETKEAGPAAYGYLVEATIGRGRIASIDAAAAERAPGVLLVLTHENAPKQPAKSPATAPQLAGPEIRHQGQPVAFVVADTFERARDAAHLVKVTYAEERGAFDLRAAMANAVQPKEANAPADSERGSFESAFTGAPVRLDVTYTTPPQAHAMMEPHATLAVPENGGVTLHTANQMLNRGLPVVAATLNLPKERVRLVSRYIGGGFGAKLQVQADAILAGMAALRLNRPVKVALTRQQVFQVTAHRSDTIQRIRLGANSDGRLVAIGHESWSDNNPSEESFETAAVATRTAYAAPNRMTRHRLAKIDLPVSAAMRAPGEAVGLLALECAMDEMAEKLGLDPVEFRIINEPTQDPEKGIPFSTRQLVPCLREGARRFGWEARRAKPGQVRDGQWLVGMGMSAAIRNNPLVPSQANVRLGPDGVVVVRHAMTDPGTGSYTIFTQVAADMLGVDVSKVRMEMGDTNFPAASGSGGSFGASSAGSAVFDACEALRAKLLAIAGIDPGTAVFQDGHIVSGNRSVALASLAGSEGIEVHGEIKPGSNNKQYTQQSYGAHFAEVGVDADTGEIRLRRMLGVFTAGRILNPKTARSQAIGGMIFGIGAALHEDNVIDPRYGSFVNRDLAEYHVPVHADVPAVEAYFLPELDERANPLKSKGIGELGICGAGAAVANAVYNASGVRVRDYPLTLDKVLAGFV